MYVCVYIYIYLHTYVYICTYIRSTVDTKVLLAVFERKLGIVHAACVGSSRDWYCRDASICASVQNWKQDICNE